MKCIIRALLILLTAMALPDCILTASGAGEPVSPNLLIDVSAAAVNSAVQRQVDRTEPAKEIIQETPVHGMSRTVGAVWAELVPDPSHAAVDVVLRGDVYARTVATRPYVLIHTTSTTPMEVRRRVVIDATGIRSFPGPACGDSTTCLLDIKCRAEPDALALCFAAKSFERKKCAAEAEGAYKAVRRTSERMAEDLSPALVSASTFVGQRLLQAKGAGLSLESMDFSTTPAFVQGRLRIATPGRRQPAPIPPFRPDIDLGLRIHESLVNEAAQAVYGGKSFPLTDLDKFYTDVTHGLLRDARTDVDKKDNLNRLQQLLAKLSGTPTTITLNRKNPLAVAFVDQGFTLEIHVASIAQDKMAYAGMRVKGTYRLENSKDGVHLVRQGRVQFFPAQDPSAAEKKLEPQPATFLVLREVLFAEVLKERLILNARPLPESASSLRLLPPRAGVHDGWLALAWNLDKSR